MLKNLRRKLVWFFSLLLIVLTVIAPTTAAYASNITITTPTEDPCDLISSISIKEFDADGYYPASFGTFLYNMEVTLHYTDGTSEILDSWNPTGLEPYWGYLRYSDSSEPYYFYLVDQNNNPVKLDSTSVPIGEFTAKISHAYEDTLYSAPIKILDIPVGNSSGNIAAFIPSDHERFEECWYSLDLPLNQEFVFKALDPSFSDLFNAHIWIKEPDNTLTKSSPTISYNVSYSLTDRGYYDFYLVISEQNAETSADGVVAWSQKKEVASLAFDPAASLRTWGPDIMNIPVNVTYTDGSTETVTNWLDCSEIREGNTRHKVTSLYTTTSNDNELYLGVVENGSWVDAPSKETIIPGTKTWKVISYKRGSTNIPASDPMEITIEDPNAIATSLNNGGEFAFTLGSNKYESYIIQPTKAQEIELFNQGSNPLRWYFYVRNTANEYWEQRYSFVLPNNSITCETCQPGFEYLLILSSGYDVTHGTITTGASAVTASATLKTETIDVADYSAWAYLQARLLFANPDGTPSSNSQTIAIWSPNPEYPGTAYTTNTNNERIFYAIHKNEALVRVPVVNKGMLAYIQSLTDPKAVQQILKDLGLDVSTLDDLAVPTGTYTVKFYRERISDETVVGTGTLNVINSKMPASTLKITSNPSSKKVNADATAKFTVKVSGENLSYQWQYRTSSSGTWKNTTLKGNKTSTLQVSATTSRSGYQFRCVVTDGTGNTATSKSATLYVLGIKSQPATAKVKVGDTAKFTVSATGYNKTYQWQYRTSSKGTWKNTTLKGNKTSTLQVSATTSRSGYQYRCVVTDGAGNKVNSKYATLYVLGIKDQPDTVKIKSGDTAKFTVSATGSGKTYQWQYRTSSKGTWKNTTLKGNKTSTLQVSATTSRNGYQYRCVVTDGAGNKVNSDAATLYVLGIKTQPASKKVSEGKTANFTVSATGHKLTYQWQSRSSSKGTWKNTTLTGNKTATLKVSATAKRNGYQFRCLVKDSAGNKVYTNAVTLTVK